MKKPIELRISAWAENQPPSTVSKQKKPVEFKPSVWAGLPESEVNKPIVKFDDKPVKLPTAQWQQISGLQSPEIIRQFEGVNQLDAFSIKDTYATVTKNITTDKYPALAVRNGNTSIRMKNGATFLTDKITGVGKYADPGATSDELHIICGARWIQYNSGTYATLKSDMNISARYSFVQFQGSWTKTRLIVTNGIGKPWTWDGTTVASLTAAPNNLNHICTHDNRVYGATGQTVYYSALRKPDDWSTVNDSGSIVVETVDSQDITALVAGSARLTVFKKNSIHELFGTNPSNYQMKMVTDSIGCPSHHTTQVVDGVIYFLGNDGVYRYSGGSMPSSDFSIPIKETLAKVPKGKLNASASWVSNRRYYLAVCSSNFTSAPDTILEYDIDFNVWNVWDLPNRVYAKGVEMGGYTYVPCDDGIVWKMDKVEPQDTRETSAGTFLNVPINYEWWSKPFTFSSLAAKSRWFKLWLVADVPTGATLNIHLSTDITTPKTWTLVQSVPSSTSLKAQEIIIPTTLVNNANWVTIRLEGYGQVVVYELSRQERVFPMGQ